MYLSLSIFMEVLNHMDLNELRKQPHLSASSINDYCDCSLQYKFGRIDKIPQESKSDALIFGSCIHKTLRDFHLERMMGGKFSLQELQQTFENHWIEAIDVEDNVKYQKGKNFEILLKEGQDLLKAYYEKLSDDKFTVLALEEPFSFTIPGLPLPIIGAFDMIEEDESGTIIIVEFKTAKKAYSSSDIDKDQLTIYQMAAESNGFKGRHILLRYDVLIKTKLPQFKQYYTTRTETDQRRCAKKIVQVWNSIEKGVFFPRQNWKCAGCAYRSACNKWFSK